MQQTSWPKSAKQAPETRPTYPVPIIATRIASPLGSPRRSSAHRFDRQFTNPGLRRSEVVLRHGFQRYDLGWAGLRPHVEAHYKPSPTPRPGFEADLTKLFPAPNALDAPGQTVIVAGALEPDLTSEAVGSRRDHYGLADQVLRASIGEIDVEGARPIACGAEGCVDPPALAQLPAEWRRPAETFEVSVIEELAIVPGRAGQEGAPLRQGSVKVAARHQALDERRSFLLVQG